MKTDEHRQRDAEETIERRRFVRFPTMLRVSYPVEDRTSFSFTVDVSAGGMFLRGARGFSVGQEVELTVGDEGTSLVLPAVVRRLVDGDESAGVGVEIDTASEAGAAWRIFMEREVVGKLEEGFERSMRNLEAVRNVAWYYVEVERLDDTINLMRRAVEGNPDSLEAHEMFAGFLVEYVRELGHEGWPIYRELRATLTAGAKLGGSETLDALTDDADGLHTEIDRRGSGPDENTLREELVTELAEDRGALEAAKKKLERQRKKLDKRATEADVEVEQARAEVEKLRAGIASDARALEEQREGLATETREIAEKRDQLAAHEQELSSQRQRLDGEGEVLDKQRHEAEG